MTSPPARESKALGTSIGRLALVAGLYFVSAKLGLVFALINPSATAVWPPAGIALGALLMFGFRVWPGILIGAFLANLGITGFGGTTIAISLGNTLEGLVGAYLIRHFANDARAFERVENIFRFVALASLGSTLLSATIGTTSLSFGGYARWESYGPIWLTWWLGNATGDLLFAPLFVLLVKDHSLGVIRQRGMELLWLLLSAILIAQLVFGGWLPSPLTAAPLTFLSVLPLLWAAFRFGQREAVMTAAVLMATALWHTVRGEGPFVRVHPNESLLLLQIYLAMMTTVTLSVAALVSEARRVSTEREALRQSAERERDRLAEEDEIRGRLVAIIEGSNDAIVGKTVNGVITSWNLAATRMFGYMAEEVIGRSIDIIIPPGRHAEKEKVLDLIRRGNALSSFETVRVRKDGTLIDISLTVSPVRDRVGRIIGASKIARDITTQKQAEIERARLLALEAAARAHAEEMVERLRTVQGIVDTTLSHVDFDQLARTLLKQVRGALRSDIATLLLLQSDGVHLQSIMQDGLPGEVDDGRILLGHSAAGRIAQSGGGLIFEDLAKVEGVSDVLGRNVRSLAGVPLRVDERLIGVIHVGSSSDRRYIDDDLGLLRLVADRVAVAIERTRLVEAEREVRGRLLANERLARAQAEEANRAKDQFLAMLGHELRNPLGAISSAMHVLEGSGTLGGISARAREVVTRQVDHLARLVDDLLDVGRLVTGKIVLDRRHVELGEVARRSLGTFTAAGKASRHVFTVQAEPAWVDADPVRAEQIVGNLLSNALKYTPAGGQISLVVALEGSEAIVKVTDDGIGISAELLPRIFDLFVQGDQSIDRARGGLGIGLTLVRRLVELHGGRVDVYSAGPGCGSTFTIHLPAVATAPADTAPRSRGEKAPPRRILVVEDSEDSREMLRHLLESDGHEVLEAEDGLHGVEIALSAQPDAALVDVGLPGLDGYEVARRIRATRQGRGILLIALTGYGLPEDRERSREAGFDVHLVKPLDPDVLDQVLKETRVP